MPAHAFAASVAAAVTSQSRRDAALFATSDGKRTENRRNARAGTPRAVGKAHRATLAEQSHSGAWRNKPAASGPHPTGSQRWRHHLGSSFWRNGETN
jgi:hypothetical protein